MSSQAWIRDDDRIEILTDEGDQLILSFEEAQNFRIEIENARLTAFIEANIGVDRNDTIAVNDIHFSPEDAEQLSVRLDFLSYYEGQRPSKLEKINWLKEGF